MFYCSPVERVYSVIGGDYTLTSRSAVDTVAIGSLMALSGPYLITDQTREFQIDPFSG